MACVSAPAVTSMSMISGSPAAAAAWSGVRPARSRAFTRTLPNSASSASSFAACRSRSRTQDRAPRAQAQWSAVWPCLRARGGVAAGPARGGAAGRACRARSGRCPRGSRPRGRRPARSGRRSARPSGRSLGARVSARRGGAVRTDGEQGARGAGVARAPPPPGAPHAHDLHALQGAARCHGLPQTSFVGSWPTVTLSQVMPSDWIDDAWFTLRHTDASAVVSALSRPSGSLRPTSSALETPSR